MRIAKRWGRAAARAAAVWAVAVAARAADGRYEIRLIERTWTPPAGVSAAAVAELAAAAKAPAAGREGTGSVHALVQLHEVPTAAARADLAAAGLDLGPYVPGNAWIAAIPAGRVADALARPEVRFVEPWAPARKVHPRLAAREVAAWARTASRPGWVMTTVRLHHDVDLSRGGELAEKAGGVGLTPIAGIHGLTVWLPEDRIADLAALEEVQWVEEGPPPLSPTNDGIRAQMKADAVYVAPYNLDGGGMRLFVYDGAAVNDTHETFESVPALPRVTRIDSTVQGNHATHVAGTAAGDGQGSPGGRGRGVAPWAWILSAGYEADPGGVIFWSNDGDIQADFAEARNVHGADLGTASLGSNIVFNTDFPGYTCAKEGDYGAVAALLDGIVRGDDPLVEGSMIMTWAEGNERSEFGGGGCGAAYGTSAPPACAKNPITVGAVNSDGSSMTRFSGWGPCDDGRLKPLVVAPGCESGRVTGETFIYSSTCGDSPSDKGAQCLSDTSYGVAGFCGTSMATPAVAGVVTLLLEDFYFHNSGMLPQPALVRAMLIHTARDLGPTGPDYRFGYGTVDAKAAIDLFRAGTGVLSGPGPTAWGTDSIGQGQTDSFTVVVPAGVGELKASLAWDDPAAAAMAATQLVDDLDLSLVAPDGTVHRPWVLAPGTPYLPATTGINSRDNQEQARVLDPAPGLWTVRVQGATVPSGPQAYALAYSLAEEKLDDEACSGTVAGFESGADGWSLSGATRLASPAPGNGSFSLRFGGADNTTHQATITTTVPAGGRTTWSYDLYLSTLASNWSFGMDRFYAEVRDLSGNPLAVLDHHTDGQVEGIWIDQANFDLTPFGGQTVQLAFHATTDASLVTSFWVDDVRVDHCPAGGVYQRASFTSIAAEDGHIKESSEFSGAGGTATSNNSLIGAFALGDGTGDEQYRGVVSFDTSSLPDGATVLWARLRLRRTGASGSDEPMALFGNLWGDLKLGGFNGSTALEAADFQASPSAAGVAFMSLTTVNGTYSYGVFDGGGVAGINKTGRTQVRLGFFRDDNDDASTDVVYIGAGENSNALYRPTLEVLYLP